MTPFYRYRRQEINLQYTRRRPEPLSNSDKDFTSMVDTELDWVVAMKYLGYDLECCVRVFAESKAVMFFAKGTRPARPISSEVWAFTVQKPNKICLVEAPDNINKLLEQEIMMNAAFSAADDNALGIFGSRANAGGRGQLGVGGIIK